jgi:hypothetical protein
LQETNLAPITDEKREYIRVTWIKDAEDMLNNFNELVDIFKKINFQYEAKEYYKD